MLYKISVKEERVDITEIMRDREGGSAFPSEHSMPGTGTVIFRGMSMLEYYAAHAEDVDGNFFDGESCADAAKALGVEKWGGWSDAVKLIAKRKFDYAEAMVAEAARRRDKKG